MHTRNCTALPLIILPSSITSNYNSEYKVLIYAILKLAVYFTDGHLYWSSCVISRKNDTLLNRCMGVDLIRLLPPFRVKLIYIFFFDKNFVF